MFLGNVCPFLGKKRPYLPKKWAFVAQETIAPNVLSDTGPDKMLKQVWTPYRLSLIIRHKKTNERINADYNILSFAVVCVPM